jgi:hypothetical protein
MCGGGIRGYWLGRHAEPGVVCEVDAVVVEVEDGVALVPVPKGKVSTRWRSEMTDVML